MKRNRKWLWPVLILFSMAAIYLLAPRLIPDDRFRFARPLPAEEAALRMTVVDAALGWAGAEEADGSHHPIIDLYNTLDPLPQDYRVTYDDAWCAAFGTVCAMEAGLTDIIPPECSCPRQVQRFRELGSWVEDDGYVPLPGDYIFYDWDLPRSLDCTGWPDHVGIVVGTFGPFIRVMEGNKDDDASQRTIWINDWCIRGYGTPDYPSQCTES